jgi:hypothetical protein
MLGIAKSVSLGWQGFEARPAPPHAQKAEDHAAIIALIAIVTM